MQLVEYIRVIHNLFLIGSIGKIQKNQPKLLNF